MIEHGNNAKLPNARTSMVRAVPAMVALILGVLALPGGRSLRMIAGATEPVTASEAPPHPSLQRWTVTGRVQTPEGTPLAGASVTAVLVLQGRTWELAHAQAQPDGAFSLPDLPEGSYWIVARSPGRARSMSTLRVHGAVPAAVTLTCGEGQVVEGAVTVLNRDGARPFVGAIVRASREGADGPGFASRTDAQGHFALHELEEGTYRVEITESGYEPLRRIGISAGATELALSVRALASVQGVVHDGHGTGVGSAVVVLAGSGVWPARRVPVLADGSFTLPGLPAGVYELRASNGDEVAEPLAPLLLDPGDHRDVTLTVGPGAALAGTVIDGATGRPLHGARVVVVEDALSTAPHALETNADGAFRLTGLLRRTHQVSVRMAGYAPRTGILATPWGAPVGVVLDRAVVVVGRVVDGHGDPIPNAQIEVTVLDVGGTAPPVTLSGSTVAFRDALFSAEARGPAPLVPAGELGVMPGRIPIVPIVPVPTGLLADRAAPGFTTDANGMFRVDDVPPGVVTVEASHPAYVRAVSEARVVRAGDELRLAMTAHTGGTLDGRVLTDRGFPVSGAVVEIRIPQEPYPRRAFSARDGTFRVPGVLGHVAVVAFAGARVAARVEVDVADDAVVPVTLSYPSSLRHVEGRVVDSRGFPIAGATLTLTTLDPAALGSATTLSADDGTFDTVIGGTGSLAVDVRHPEYAPHTVRVESTVRPIQITLSAGGALTLEVHGDGCVSGPVTLEARTPCGPVRATVDERRTVRLERLCAGRVTVMADADGCIRAERVATVPATGVVDIGRLDLVAGGGAEGNVEDVHGEPVPGARVAPAEAPDDATTGVARSDRRGDFAVANLPVGDVPLVASHPALGHTEPVNVRIIRGTVARGVRLRFAGAFEGAARAVLAATVTLRDGVLGPEVATVARGSAAERAGLRPGDRVVSVGGVDVTNRVETEGLMTGARNDDVVLQVERDGNQRTVRYAR